MRLSSILAGPFFVLALAVPPTTRASEPHAAIPPELVLQRFPVKKGGDALLVPVRFGGKDHAFLVDTGAGRTAFDRSLRPGNAKTRMIDTIIAGDGKRIEAESYDPPDARVGSLPLGIEDGVTSLDLKAASEAYGLSIEGILGMDFLGRYVVHVDFDRGELLFLKSIPKDAGEALPISWEAGNSPTVVGAVTGAGLVRFGIDTGLIGFDSGMLAAREVKTLVSRERVEKVSVTRFTTFSGTGSASVYRGSLLALGGFAVEGPVFGENPRYNLLGLYFWSRFAITFDFPGRNVFLRRGEGFGRPDLWNRSGLHWVVKDGSKIIESVDEGSPASVAGVRAGDVLLKLEDLRAEESNAIQLVGRYWEGGRMECLVRRGSEERRLILQIPRGASPDAVPAGDEPPENVTPR